MKGMRFEMKNVVYLPDLRENLLSVKRFSESGFELLFKSKIVHTNKAAMKNNGQVIAEAFLRARIDHWCTPSQLVCNRDEFRVVSSPSQHAMENLLKFKMVTRIEAKLKKIEFWETCVKGKQCRDPFNGCRERTSRANTLGCVLGLIDPPVWDRSRYFVSFIDDYIHFAVIHENPVFVLVAAVVGAGSAVEQCSVWSEQTRESFWKSGKQWL